MQTLLIISQTFVESLQVPTFGENFTWHNSSRHDFAKPGSLPISHGLFSLFFFFFGIYFDSLRFFILSSSRFTSLLTLNVCIFYFYLFVYLFFILLFFKIYFKYTGTKNFPEGKESISNFFLKFQFRNFTWKHLYFFLN